MHDIIWKIAAQLIPVSDTPLLDARLLCQAAQDDSDKLNAYIERRLKHEPVSKIIGKRGFWKADFFSTVDVLDPRPDSEILIDAVLRFYPKHRNPYRILDIGVGSGCLLFSLLDEYPIATGIGIDKSIKALQVAEKNQQGRSATLIQADFTQENWSVDLGQFDIVVSNPPYIPSADIDKLAPDVYLYDPRDALDGGTDGLDAYRHLTKRVYSLLKPNAFLFLEIGINQAESVSALFQAAGLSLVETAVDFGAIPRALIFQKRS